MATETDTMIDALKKLLAAKFATDRSADTIGDDEPLMEGGLNLDSIGIVELIAAVEAEFAFQFQDTDLRTATFETVRSLTDAIANRLNG